MSPSSVRPGVPEDDHSLRQMETMVLGQVRDNMTLMSAALQKMGDKLEQVHTGVTELKAADYAAQILRLELSTKEDQGRIEAGLQRQIVDNKAMISAHETRINAQALQLARYGLAMAITGAIGATALTTAVGIIVSRMMGQS